MAKLTEKERDAFEKIMEADLKPIHVKLMNQIKDFWAKAREEVIKAKGWDKLMEEKRQLEAEQSRIRGRIHQIEDEMKSEALKPEQIVELGGEPDKWGHYKGATFHGIPVESQFEYEIVEYIRQHIDLRVPAKFLHDLGRACMRELAMSGTFEEARKAYAKFYSLDFRKYGVDIPPRLSEVGKQKAVLGTTKEMLSLKVPQQNERRIAYEGVERQG